MSREYRRGSIVSFIVVGIVLVALVLGGLYVAKNQLGSWLGGSAQPTDQDGREVARETTDQNTDRDKPTQEDSDKQSAPESEDKTPPASDGTVDEQTGEPTQEGESAGDDDTAPAADTDTGDESMPTTGVEMPQTGLSDSLLTAFPLVVLAAAVVAYRRSTLL